MFDLAAYLDRIGLAAPDAPTREALDALILAHLGAIPFENLDPLSGRVPAIDLAGVTAKLVGQRRGGYCYEQNHLALAALQALGYEARGLLCRVWWQRPEGTPPGPLSHMALLVRVGGHDLLADVGFGGCVPTATLDFATDAPQQTPHERFRLRPLAEGWMLEVEIGGTWQRVYELGHDMRTPEDFAAANLRTATEGKFTEELMMARTTPEARLSLGGARFTCREADGTLQERRTFDAEGLARVMEERFHLPVDPAWRPILARIAGMAEA